MDRSERVTSEVIGAAKAAKAVVEGLTGVFKELVREHGEMAALLSRVKLSSDVEVRRELFPEIREALISHEKGELGEVYPVFKQHADLAGYADTHERDAGALERRIQQLSALSYEDDGWSSAFEELVNAVSQHVKEEESEFFPAASRTLGKDVSEGLTSRYLARKQAAAKEARQ